jgi:hypothetical protein
LSTIKRKVTLQPKRTIDLRSASKVYHEITDFQTLSDAEVEMIQKESHLLENLHF